MSRRSHILGMILLCLSATLGNAQSPPFIFSEPINVMTISTNRWDNMPHVSTNGLEIFFASDGGGGLGDIHVATRTALNEAFENPVRLGGTPGRVNFMGSLSEDDLALYYTSFAPPTGISSAYVVRRASVRQNFDFDSPVAIRELRRGFVDMQFGHVTNDGLRAYFNAFDGSNHRPYLAARETTGEPFSHPKQLTHTSHAVEYVTRDELKMLSWSRSAGGQGRADLFLSNRATINDEFAVWENLGPVVNSASEETFGFLHELTSTLYFSSDRSTGSSPPPGPSPVRDIWQSKYSFAGDFDFDHSLTAADIDRLAEAIRDDQYHFNFDTNQDGEVNLDDHRLWVTGENFANTSPGDADLNQEVNFADFLALSNRFGQAGGWAEGDFDGNGIVGFPDFLALSANFSQSNEAIASVPEPASFSLVVFVLIACLICKRSCLL